jgi:hypothetical protein
MFTYARFLQWRLRSVSGKGLSILKFHGFHSTVFPYPYEVSRGLFF